MRTTAKPKFAAVLMSVLLAALLAGCSEPSGTPNEPVQVSKPSGTPNEPLAAKGPAAARPAPVQ